MSDLIIDVRQIGSYPQLGASAGSEIVLLQDGPIGSPYATISTANLVATALNAGPAMGVGTAAPANAAGSQVFVGSLIFPEPGGGPLYNLYFDTNDQLRYVNAGIGGAVAFEASDFVWQVAPAGSAGQLLASSALSNLMVLSTAGNLSLPLGTLTVARDPASYFDVATMGWVSNSTVQSFNQRKGQVTLTSQDVYNALRLCDPIATQPWVQSAINASIQNLLWTCPFVNTWNGRKGSVYLMLSDITTVFYQSGQQPISPTPIPTSNDDSIATTSFVNAAINELTGGPFLQLAGGTMLGDIAPYFGTVNTNQLIDLITSQPPSGIYQTAGASNIQAEPILGPHWGVDFTRARTVSYATTTLGSNVGEYMHLYNLIAATGFPAAWQANTAYLLHDTVTNGGNMYSVTTAGTSAASGGPSGTGASIADGTVVWMYQAANQAENGGKVNLGVFTYADVNSGHAWGIANDLQISAGSNKVAAYAQEIDLNNYRMDYDTGPPGPAAVALQIFAGGPNRSSYAIAVAAQGTPTDPANFVYGLTMQGAQLVSDADILLNTGANIGVEVQGVRSAANSTAIYCADTSQNAIIIGGTHSNQDIWITDTAPTVLTVGGTHTNVVNITGTISGLAWNGSLSASEFVASSPTGPTIRGGTGAATGTQPPGSLWLRSDGAVGTHLYVSAGGGTWTPVAGV